MDRTSGRSSSWKLPIEDFIASLYSQGRSDSTLRYYESRLWNLAQWTLEKQIEFEDFTLRHMEQFMACRRQATGPRGKPLSASTLRHDGNAARTFFHWCWERNMIERDPLQRFKLPKRVDPEVHVPTAAEVETFLQVIIDRKASHKKNSKQRNEAGFHQARDLGLACVLAECGLRISEAIALRDCDYDRERLLLHIQSGKTKRARSIPITRTLHGVLGRWADVREDIVDAFNEEQNRRARAGERALPPLPENLFLTIYGTSMKADSVREWLHRCQKDAGLPSFNLHALRHFALSELVHRSGVLAAREVAGHQSIATTNRYSHIHPARVREAVENASVLATVLRQHRPIRERRWKVTGK